MERKMHFRENWLIFLGIWGEAELILRIWGAKEKYSQGAEEFWEISALFSGIKGANTPWGPQYYIRYALMGTRIYSLCFDRYSNLFLNAHINRHVHAEYLKMI